MDLNGIFALVSVLLFLVLGRVAPQSEEIFALLEFAKGIRSDPLGLVSGTWNKSNIQSDGCPATSWRGVTCTGGHVTALVLDNFHLAGEVSLKTLSNLRMVGNLSLAGNLLSGGLEPEITNMSSLQHLDLSHNRFRGRIPKGFQNLYQLRHLDLHSNQLNGHIDMGLVNLQSAVFVDLSSNMLSGPLPPLETIGSNIRNTLQYLNVSNNRLTGALVYNVEVPFQNLKVLDMSNNQFSGKLPSFEYVYALETLRLGSNSFSGQLPSALFGGSSLNLQELDLSNNNLSGDISAVSSASLKVINLSSNKLSGSLPIKLEKCVVVNLRNNKLSGNLSTMKMWGNSIETLDLSKNLLSGSLPNDTSQFLKLTYLNLSHNTFDGPLPSVLGTYPVINVIDLSFNSFNGPVLTNLFTVPTLVHLHLSNNNLSGIISLHDSQSVRPATALGQISAINLSPLESLDLSDNVLVGSIPSQIGDFVSLRTLNLARNHLSKTIPGELHKLRALVVLDLSGNQLIGKLPDDLPDSMKSFNVSFNDLSGIVPPNLRQFPESSFHPGNSGLINPNLLSSTEEPSGFSPNTHGGVKHRIKAIIIGTCTAVVALLLVLALILYARRNSRFEYCGRHATFQSREIPNEQDKGKTLASGYRNMRRASDPHPLSFSGKHLLSPEKRSLSLNTASLSDSAGKDTSDINPEGLDSSVLSTKNGRRSSSPGSNTLLSSPHAEDEPISENPVVLNVQSPDRLEGDIFFFDTTITFTVDELSCAPAEVLGRSSYGTSYKATLENGHTLTVKWLREGLAKSKNEFTREAKKFRKIKHPNLVSMRGYYWGPSEHEKLILSDYVTPSNLAQHLYEQSNIKSSLLDWHQRLKIAVDVGRGLVYLHCDVSLPHGNLKAANILLDGPELNGKLSDYCLHLLTTSAGTAEQIFNAGALGYRAPELAPAKKPKPSFKADVYAFGVILVEIITGNSAGDIVCESSGVVDLTDWVKQLATQGRGMDCFDSSLRYADTQEFPKGIDDVLAIALQCMQPVSERPSIRKVFEDLTTIEN